MVGPGGLEPPTSRLSGVRSNHLSYEPSTLDRPAGVHSSSERMPQCVLKTPPQGPMPHAGNVSIGRAAKAAAWDLQKARPKPGVPDLATPSMGAAVLALCLMRKAKPL